MNRRTFRRIFGYTSTVPSVMPQLAPKQDKRDLGRYSIPEASAFYDVTEAYGLEMRRSHWDFHPRRLRKSLARLRKNSRFERPLLRQELSVIPEFQNLVATIPEKGVHVHVDVAHDGNLVLPEFVKSMGLRITRDSKGKPVRIYPWKESGSEDAPVSMDTEVMSGELVVTGTRIPAKRIVAKSASGKSAEEIADSYRLDRDLIRKVLLHFEREKPQKAS